MESFIMYPNPRTTLHHLCNKRWHPITFATFHWLEASQRSCPYSKRGDYLCCLVPKSCLTLFDPMDCSPQSFSIHEISQTKILTVLLFPPPGDLPNPRVWTWVSCIGRWILYHWATREALEETIRKYKYQMKMMGGVVPWSLSATPVDKYMRIIANGNKYSAENQIWCYDCDWHLLTEWTEKASLWKEHLNWDLND